jgi:hypothetical protein
MRGIDGIEPRRGVTTLSNSTARNASRSNIALNLTIDQLRERLGSAGNPDDQEVYGYVIASVVPDGRGGFLQTGSAPNWEGDTLTLCTCKHEMRTYLPPVEWLRGKWIAGLCGWSLPFRKQQSLVTLMRVGEAYSSHAELVQALRDSGRQAVVDAKDSRVHKLGDLMIPRGSGMPANPFDPGSYERPIPGHAHSSSKHPDGWHNDVDHLGRSGRQPAMLVGDPALTFRWTQPMVRRRRPGLTKPCRIWPLAEFLDDIEGVPV